MNTLKEYIERLYREWIEHKSIIIDVDFDDTISPWKLAGNDHCIEVIKLLKKARETGAYIIIFTACNKDRYSQIRGYCETKGLQIDGINENPIKLPYGNDSKPYANIYLDDRAGLNESMTILESAMYKVRGKIEQERLQNSNDFI